MKDKLFIVPTREPTETRRISTHNLPAELTPLIGREREVAAACALLRGSEVRLLTLTGPGGVGKTRLGLQIATDLLSTFADGFRFVSLAPITDPGLVIPSIAQAFGLLEARGLPRLEHLKAALHEKHLLLLLDNFEQVLMAAPSLSDLLVACTELKILVTSRAVLHLQGEHEFPVPPLALPDLKRLPELGTLSQYAAIRLFLQRAQASKPDFQITKAHAPAIAAVCVRLDGLPLAIELAAARIKLLPPQALLKRLEHRLPVLTSGAQNVPARQQTLRNTIQWSYDLLSAEEQRLFQRLSVFVGGCTLEAVEEVCAVLDGGDSALPVLDGVASLIDKSMLQQVEQEGEQPRLLMLETIREYGLECLVTSEEAEIIRRAHAEYYLRLSEKAEPKLRSAQQAVWVGRLEREFDNLRTVFRWLVEREEMEMALCLGGALWQFWAARRHVSEGRQWLDGALSRSSREGVPVPVLAKALHSAGVLAYSQGDYARATALLRESLALFRELGNQPGIAASINGLAYVALMNGDSVAAYAMFQESLVIHRQLGDKWNIADTLYFMALAVTLVVDQGDPALAQAMLEEGLAILRELEDQQGVAYTLNLLGFVSLLQGHWTGAHAMIEESLAIHKALGNRLGIAYALLSSGWLSISQGNYVAAGPMYAESLAIMIELDDKWFIAASLEGLAVVAATQEQFERAACLWGAAESLRQAIAAPMRYYERAINEWGIATARAHLGEEVFTASWAEGRRLTLEQALAAAGPATLPMPIPAGQPSTPPAKKSPPYPAPLTQREVEVLRLVANGLTDARIAEQLVISPRTVSTHLTSIYGKIQVSSRSGATRYAIEHKLV